MLDIEREVFTIGREVFTIPDKVAQAL